MDVVRPVVARAKPPVFLEVRERAFDGPAVVAEGFLSSRAAAAKVGLNAEEFEECPVPFAIAASVRMEFPRAFFREGLRQKDDRQGKKQAHVVDVRSGDKACKRQAARIGEQMMFTPQLASVSRVRARAFPPRPPHGAMTSPQGHVTSRSRRVRRVRKAASPTRCPTHPLDSTRACGASTSCRSQSPFPSANPPKECQSSARIGCRSGMRDQGRVACRPAPFEGAAAGALVRYVTTGNRGEEAWPREALNGNDSVLKRAAHNGKNCFVRHS